MASAPYKLSSILKGHEMDVRCVAVTKDGCIVSASRDRVAKLWRRNEDAGYSEEMAFVGHESFVNSVCVLPPGPLWHDGAIVTGSHDTKIRVYSPNNSLPLLILSGHTKAVCYVSPGLESGTIVSSSWDGRSCIWKTDGTGTPVLDLYGHEGSVWCAIQLASGEIVTGSADMTLKVWNHSTPRLTLKGHTDVVRDVVAISTNEFLSCSNDTSVKHWNALNGNCLATFWGHSNYIYSISILPQGGADSFVSSGEDGSLLIWSFGEVLQSITAPVMSVWSTACLPNGDIIVGSSDGAVRVYSSDPSRHTAVEDKPSQSAEMPILDEENVPGKEALAQPGKTDGEVKLVRENNVINIYEWSAAENKWKENGTFSKRKSKPQYKGKEYDYVFNVDVGSDKPPLQLPYNSYEDPWDAAQVFLRENNLSPLFLEQVAEFIIQQCDHYSPPRPVPFSQASMSDPLTGDSRYRVTDRVPSPENSYFPHKQFHRFDNGNLKQIQDKLSEFNRKTGDGSHKVDDCALQELVKLAELGAPASAQYLEVLKELLELWPKDILFPVLDITRLAIRNAETNRYMCSGKAGEKLFEILQRFPISSSPTANQMLILRIYCNMFLHPDGEALAMKYRDKLVSLVLELLPNTNKSVQIALATLVLNLAVAFNHTKDTSSNLQCVKVTMKALPQLTEPEAQFRALVALGTLLCGAGDENVVKEVSSLDELKVVLKQLIISRKKSDTPSQLSATINKIIECAQKISDLLNK